MAMIKQFMAERVELVFLLLLLAIMLTVFYPPAKQVIYIIIGIAFLVGVILFMRSSGIIGQVPEKKLNIRREYKD